MNKVIKVMSLAVVLLASVQVFVSCGGGSNPRGGLSDIERVDVERQAEYYYSKIKTFETLQRTVGLSDEDRQQLQELEYRVNDYIAGLSSEGKEVFYETMSRLGGSN